MARGFANSSRTRRPFEILRKQRTFEAAQVQQVTVQLATDEAAIVNNREIPDICLQHMVAVMLMDKTVSFVSAHDQARLKDPATLRERAQSAAHPRSGTRTTHASSRRHRQCHLGGRISSHPASRQRSWHSRKSDDPRRNRHQGQ